MAKAITNGYDLLGNLSPQHAHVVKILADAFADAGKHLYLVGGPVRDLLLGLAPSDIDFTTDALPAETRAIGEAIPGSSIYDIGELYGTIGIVVPVGHESIPVEITTFRSETYEPGDRHPDVRFGDDITADLSRSDADVRTGTVRRDADQDLEVVQQLDVRLVRNLLNWKLRDGDEVVLAAG